MKEIVIKAGTSEYTAHVGTGLLDTLPARLHEAFPGSRFAVITDENVGALHAGRFSEALTRQGVPHHGFTIAPGESSKSIAVYAELLSSLVRQGFSRSDVILALGGGVVGDLAGFTAATHLRGVKYVQIPTTLLAQIDSSIGGKTGVDLPEGKNLAGAYYHPTAVYADTELLKTLPAQDFADGMAELIKYALISDAGMLAALEENEPLRPGSPELEEMIARCVTIKRDIVAADERDTGGRMVLNFGHTVGHGIERLCARRGIFMTHGRAVAMGMVAVLRAGERHGLTAPDTAKRTAAVLKKYGLPHELDGYDRQEIIEGISVDKKNLEGRLNLVMISEPGQVFLHRIPLGDIGQYV